MRFFKNFIRGMATLIEIQPEPAKTKRPDFLNKTDHEALCKDWEAMSPEVSLSIILYADNLVNEGRVDDAIDLIFTEIDSALRAGRFDICDNILESIDPHDLSDDLVLALLTATLPAASKLPSRQSFYERAKKHLGEDKLTGLEG